MADAYNHYPTPPEATRALMDREVFSDLIWEPCAGWGGMASTIRETHDCHASTIESVPQKIKDVVHGDEDLFDFVLPPGKQVITNPPYGDRLPEKMLRRLIRIGCTKIAFLLNFSFLSSEHRFHGLFQELRPIRVLVFADRVTMYPAGWKGQTGTSTQSMAWFIWEYPFGAKHLPAIDWIYAKPFKDSA